jgi:hypothetical protein
MCDLEKALAKVNEFLGVKRNCVLFRSIKPSVDGGIVFETTCDTYIKWFPNGEVVERNKGDWRKK